MSYLYKTKGTCATHIEVELDGNGLYPSRIDRYYTDGVELIFNDDLDDDF